MDEPKRKRENEGKCVCVYANEKWQQKQQMEIVFVAIPFRNVLLGSVSSGSGINKTVKFSHRS